VLKDWPLKLFQFAYDDFGQHLDGLADDLGAVAVCLNLPLVSVADGASGLGKSGVIFDWKKYLFYL
jgi:hypothetical protein